MATQLNNLSYLKVTRENLRKNLTESELLLWEVLKDKKLCGRKFRRQHSVGHYIEDFYCTSERLIIELDGQHHYTPDVIVKDLDRNIHLAIMNIKVLRFGNKEILNNLTNVLKVIKDNFKATP